MVETLTVFRAAMGTAGLALLATAVWVDRRRETAALRPFVLFVGAVGTLAVADSLAAGNLTSLSVVWLTTFLAIPCAFTWFVVEYYGLPHLASPARKVAFLAPAAVALVGGTALIVGPEMAGSMAGGGPTAPALPSVLGFAALAEQVGLYYAGGVMLAGVALLVRTVAEYEYLDRRLAAVLSFVAVWPWLAYVLTPGIASRVALDSVIGLNATGYSLSLAAVGFAVTRGGIFDAAPAAGTLGPETVLAELDDAAAETFGVDPAAVTAEPLSGVVGADLDALRDSESVELSVPEGTRHFEASVSPVSDRFDREPGHAVVLTDVTQERVRSQRLSVLNRVLRHNLRNGMTNIIGRAQLIADGEHEHADTAESILSSADDLMTASERARQIEEMMAAAPAFEGHVALADLAEHVHGSGLGLWAVKWGVVRLGGELAFRDREPHGTVVTIDLPRGDRPDAAAPASAGAD